MAATQCSQHHAETHSGIKHLLCNIYIPGNAPGREAEGLITSFSAIGNGSMRTRGEDAIAGRAFSICCVNQRETFFWILKSREGVFLPIFNEVLSAPDSPEALPAPSISRLTRKGCLWDFKQVTRQENGSCPAKYAPAPAISHHFLSPRGVRMAHFTLLKRKSIFQSQEEAQLQRPFHEHGDNKAQLHPLAVILKGSGRSIKREFTSK